jgi:hypothetical protein
MCSKHLAADAALALGGLRMKLVKLFCTVALLAVSAAAVKAGSIGNDPKFTINKPGGTAQPGVRFLGNANPLGVIVIDFNSSNLSILDPVLFPWAPGKTIDLVYDGVTPLVISTSHPLYIGIKSGIPFGTQFSCGGDAFLTCDKGQILDCGDDVVCEEGFLFGGYNAVGNKIPPGTTLSATLEPLVNETPEPSTILMFLSLGPAIGFAKKRWNARQSI